MKAVVGDGKLMDGFFFIKLNMGYRFMRAHVAISIRAVHHLTVTLHSVQSEDCFKNPDSWAKFCRIFTL